MSVGDRIKEKRLENNMTLLEVANLLGVKEATVQRYESGGIKNLKQHTIAQLAEIFNTTPAYLMGWEDDQKSDPDLPPGAFPVNPNKRIPLLGQIAAGLPLYAEQNIEGYIWTDRNHGGEYFALRVRGDSMNAAKINDGDIIIVKKQEAVNPNDIAVVLVDDEATIKRYKKDGGMVILTPQSTNPVNQVQIYNLKDHSIRILGRVVESRTEY